MTGASHSNSCKGWARQDREFEKELGVRSAARGFFQAGTVADGFAQFVERSLQPPAEGAEPEEACVDSGEQLQVEVALANVRSFVGQNDAQLLLVPAVVVGRQNNARSYVHGRCNAGTGAHGRIPWAIRQVRDRLGGDPQANGSREA